MATLEASERRSLEVAATNAPARALYARLGYGPAGRRGGYYRPAGGPPVDALVLRKPLIPAAGKTI